MSAWIVEDKSINYLITFFGECSYSSELLQSRINHKLQELNINLQNDEEDLKRTELGKALIEMNEKAYKSCYGKKIKIDLDHINNYKFQYEKTGFQTSKNTLYQILKTLQCYLYQCSEGSINKKPLFKTLSLIEGFIKDEIISQNELYKNAEWK